MAAPTSPFKDVISMRRFLTLLAALAIAATLAVALVVVAPAAQEERAPRMSKARPPIGLAVFSSDGKQLGKPASTKTTNPFW